MGTAGGGKTDHSENLRNLKFCISAATTLPKRPETIDTLTLPLSCMGL
jgi:hypothetical protein